MSRIKMPLVQFLSTELVKILSINVLVVSHILVGSVIFGMTLEEMTFS